MTIEARFYLARDAFTLDVGVSIPSLGVTALIGPSGAGKTTLLRLIAGLEVAPGGALTFAGEVWQDASNLVPTYRRAIGYVFQEADLFAHLNVRRNLEYGFSRVPVAARRVGFDVAIELLELRDLLARRPATLSGGERQRVAIGRALLTSPKLLLMDEPLAALDAASKRDVIPYLDRLHADLGIPMLYVSHSIDEVARLADHVVLLDGGRVRAQGPLIAMLSRLDSPLSQDEDAESVIEATVEGHDDSFHLTHLRFAAGRFTVARTPLDVGAGVRVRVAARDVSLTLARPNATSILNVLAARVAGVREDHPGQCTVQLDLGQVGRPIPMLARITAKSAATLGIAPGRELFAQVKSVALLGPTGPLR